MGCNNILITFRQAKIENMYDIYDIASTLIYTSLYFQIIVKVKITPTFAYNQF